MISRSPLRDVSLDVVKCALTAFPDVQIAREMFKAGCECAKTGRAAGEDATVAVNHLVYREASSCVTSCLGLSVHTARLFYTVCTVASLLLIPLSRPDATAVNRILAVVVSVTPMTEDTSSLTDADLHVTICFSLCTIAIICVAESRQPSFRLQLRGHLVQERLALLNRRRRPSRCSNLRRRDGQDLSLQLSVLLRLRIRGYTTVSPHPLVHSDRTHPCCSPAHRTCATA